MFLLSIYPFIQYLKNNVISFDDFLQKIFDLLPSFKRQHIFAHSKSLFFSTNCKSY